MSFQPTETIREDRELIKNKLGIASWVAKEAEQLQERKDRLSYLRKLGKRLRQPNTPIAI